MISIKQLNYRYRDAPKAALADLNLSIESGALFGLLGPNGAGKTTLLSILSGLLRCSADTVFVDQCDVSAGDISWRSKLSLVPQEYSFYNQLTVIENLTFFGGAQGLNAATLKERVDEAAKISGLEDRLGDQAVTLSGGLKRRLNLAIGMLNRPRLLLLDEPTVGIDPHSRHFILETIRKINQQGTTVIYTSHYMEEVEALCDQIAIIDDGKVLVQGSLSQLLERQSDHILCIDFIESPGGEQIEALAQVLDFNFENQQFRIGIHSNAEIIMVLEQLKQQQLNIAHIHYGSQNLEDLFLDLTQCSLRD